MFITQFWYFPEAEPAALDDEVNICGEELIFDSFAEFVDVGVVFFSDDFYVQSGVFCFFDAGHG